MSGLDGRSGCPLGLQRIERRASRLIGLFRLERHSYTCSTIISILILKLSPACMYG